MKMKNFTWNGVCLFLEEIKKSKFYIKNNKFDKSDKNESIFILILEKIKSDGDFKKQSIENQKNIIADVVNYFGGRFLEQDFDFMLLVEKIDFSRAEFKKIGLNFRSENFMVNKLVSEYERGHSRAIIGEGFFFLDFKNIDDVLKKLINDRKSIGLKNNVWQIKRRDSFLWEEKGIYFLAAINDGFTPNISEWHLIIKNMILGWDYWGNDDTKKGIELFSEYFANSNVFINTIAPTKDYMKNLTLFVEKGLGDNYIKMGNFNNIVNKKEMFLDSPFFKHKSLEKKINKAISFKVFGKSLLNKDEMDSLMKIDELPKKRTKI